MIRALTIAILVGLIGMVFGPTARAAESGDVLRISPVRQTFSISPGRTGQIKVFVSNPTERPVTLQPVINDFTARDNKGTPALLADPIGLSSGRSFKRLVGPLGRVVVPAGGDKEVSVSVAVPTDAAPGGYYGAIRFDPVQGAANVTMSAASLVLLNVPGDIEEKVNLASFIIEPTGLSFGQFWIGDNSAKLSVGFSNDGDVHEAPVGQIYLKLGDDVVKKIDFNQTDPRSYILPGSGRSWQFDIGKLDQFGRYTVGAVFSYGSDNKTIEVDQSFWVVPLAYLIGGGVGLLLACLLIVSLLLRRSSRKK